MLLVSSIRYFSNLLSKSVREIVPNNAPNYSSTHENNMALLETYENTGPYFRTLIFNKGPLLALSTHNKDMIGLQ